MFIWQWLGCNGEFEDASDAEVSGDPQLWGRKWLRAERYSVHYAPVVGHEY
jgi:hypothetical protein